MEIHELISLITNLVTALAAIAAIVIARMGLMTWRNELHGRANFDLARRVMIGVYEIRDEIRKIRNVFSDETTDVQYARLNTKENELAVTLLEAEVIWGPNLHSSKQRLEECLLELRRAIRRQSRSKSNNTPPLAHNHKQVIETILYERGDDDEFSKSFQHAVKEFENALRPYFGRKK